LLSVMNTPTGNSSTGKRLEDNSSNPDDGWTVVSAGPKSLRRALNVHEQVDELKISIVENQARLHALRKQRAVVRQQQSLVSTYYFRTQKFHVKHEGVTAVVDVKNVPYRILISKQNGTTIKTPIQCWKQNIKDCCSKQPGDAPVFNYCKNHTYVLLNRSSRQEKAEVVHREMQTLKSTLHREYKELEKLAATFNDGFDKRFKFMDSDTLEDCIIKFFAHGDYTWVLDGKMYSQFPDDLRVWYNVANVVTRWHAFKGAHVMVKAEALQQGLKGKDVGTQDAVYIGDKLTNKLKEGNWKLMNFRTFVDAGFEKSNRFVILKAAKVDEYVKFPIESMAPVDILAELEDYFEDSMVKYSQDLYNSKAPITPRAHSSHPYLARPMTSQSPNYATVKYVMLRYLHIRSLAPHAELTYLHFADKVMRMKGHQLQINEELIDSYVSDYVVQNGGMFKTGNRIYKEVNKAAIDVNSKPIEGPASVSTAQSGEPASDVKPQTVSQPKVEERKQEGNVTQAKQPAKQPPKAPAKQQPAKQQDTKPAPAAPVQQPAAPANKNKRKGKKNYVPFNGSAFDSTRPVKEEIKNTSTGNGSYSCLYLNAGNKISEGGTIPTKSWGSFVIENQGNGWCGYSVLAQAVQEMNIPIINTASEQNLREFITFFAVLAGALKEIPDFTLKSIASKFWLEDINVIKTADALGLKMKMNLPYLDSEDRPCLSPIYESDGKDYYGNFNVMFHANHFELVKPEFKFYARTLDCARVTQDTIFTGGDGLVKLGWKVSDTVMSMIAVYLTHESRFSTFKRMKQRALLHLYHFGPDGFIKIYDPMMLADDEYKVLFKHCVNNSLSNQKGVVYNLMHQVAAGRTPFFITEDFLEPINIEEVDIDTDVKSLDTLPQPDEIKTVVEDEIIYDYVIGEPNVRHSLMKLLEAGSRSFDPVEKGIDVNTKETTYFDNTNDFGERLDALTEQLARDDLREEVRVIAGELEAIKQTVKASEEHLTVDEAKTLIKAYGKEIKRKEKRRRKEKKKAKKALKKQDTIVEQPIEVVKNDPWYIRLLNWVKSIFSPFTTNSGGAKYMVDLYSHIAPRNILPMCIRNVQESLQGMMNRILIEGDDAVYICTHILDPIFNFLEAMLAVSMEYYYFPSNRLGGGFYIPTLADVKRIVDSSVSGMKTNLTAWGNHHTLTSYITNINIKRINQSKFGSLDAINKSFTWLKKKTPNPKQICAATASVALAGANSTTNVVKKIAGETGTMISAIAPKTLKVTLFKAATEDTKMGVNLYLGFEKLGYKIFSHVNMTRWGGSSIISQVFSRSKSNNSGIGLKMNEDVRFICNKNEWLTKVDIGVKVNAFGQALTYREFVYSNLWVNNPMYRRFEKFKRISVEKPQGNKPKNFKADMENLYTNLTDFGTKGGGKWTSLLSLAVMGSLRAVGEDALKTIVIPRSSMRVKYPRTSYVNGPSPLPFSVDSVVNPCRFSVLDDSWFVKDKDAKTSLAGVWRVEAATLPVLDACNTLIAQANQPVILSQRGRVRNPNPLLRVVNHVYWTNRQLSLPSRMVAFILKSLIKIESVPFYLYAPVIGLIPLRYFGASILSSVLIGSTPFLKWIYLALAYEKITDRSVISLSLIHEITLPTPNLNDLDPEAHVKRRAALQAQVHAMASNIAMTPQVKNVLDSLPANTNIDPNFLANTCALLLASYEASDCINQVNKMTR